MYRLNNNNQKKIICAQMSLLHPDMTIQQDSKDKLVIVFPNNKCKITWYGANNKGVIEGKE